MNNKLYTDYVIIKKDNLEIPLEHKYITYTTMKPINGIIEYDYPYSLYYLLTLTNYNVSKPIDIYEYLITINLFVSERLYLYMQHYLMNNDLKKLNLNQLFAALEYLVNYNSLTYFSLLTCFIDDCAILKFLNQKTLTTKIGIIKKLLLVNTNNLISNNKEYEYISGSNHVLYYRNNKNYYLLSSHDCIMKLIDLPELNCEENIFFFNENDYHCCYFILNNVIFATYFIINENNETKILKQITVQISYPYLISKDKIFELKLKNANVAELNVYTFEKKLLKTYCLIQEELDYMVSAGCMIKIKNCYYSENEKVQEFTWYDVTAATMDYCILQYLPKNTYYLVTDKIKIKFDLSEKPVNGDFCKNKLRILNLITASI